MRVCVAGPYLEDFDATDAINLWLSDGPGTRHIEGHKAPVKHL